MISRRSLLTAASVSLASAALAGCTTTRSSTPPPPRRDYPVAWPTITPTPTFDTPELMYASVEDGGHSIPAVPFSKIDPRYLRQVVSDPTGEAPGTVVVDTGNHFLYVVLPNRQAVRYGVGLGRAGFEWSGRAEVEWKQHWPRWFPPEEMIARQRELEKYRAIYDRATNTWNGGMPAGIGNPLGARALYIYQDGKDTLYRLHGSPEWWSIGKSVSSGCVRLINQDVIDLYERVPEKSPIVVTSGLATS
ncbi:L,D-transpeptidase [Aquamicrobium sp. LC103]|uniref:L,D-transpeptidase n=1 Tax=Aquamicrobium sp. LC103 TaxID=1120658 RepID=UPI00063E9723|nr:L,D-transpeptidase [Aquamicrobium sp. LC103]TKT81474.1 L,D-transpeptidase [Aquamicrobium sp. LC103]